MRRASVFALGLVFVASAARANIAPTKCQSSLETVEMAQLIVIARAKSVETGTGVPDGRYAMRVTYTVDEVLSGTKTSEVVVETPCNPIPAKRDAHWTDQQRHCDAKGDAMPGLTEDGKVGTAPAALLLGASTSVLDGKPVLARDRHDWWRTCPSDEALLAKSPRLKAILDKAKATNEKTTWGFVMPPAPPPEPTPPPSTSASAAPPAASVDPDPPLVAKKSGCGGCAISSGDSAGAWPLLLLVALGLRRRGRLDIGDR